MSDLIHHTLVHREDGHSEIPRDQFAGPTLPSCRSCDLNASIASGLFRESLRGQMVQPSIWELKLTPLMIARIKPRGFTDYGLFALLLSGLFALLFWIEAGKEFRWADSALAPTAAIVGVFLIILTRSNERAAWIVTQNWPFRLLIFIGICFYSVLVLCADSFLLHRGPLTDGRFERDIVIVLVPAGIAVGVSLRQWRRQERYREAGATMLDRPVGRQLGGFGRRVKGRRKATADPSLRLPHRCATGPPCAESSG